MYIHNWWNRHITLNYFGLFKRLSPSLQYKLAGWISVYCAVMLMANSKAADDSKSVFTLLL